VVENKKVKIINKLTVSQQRERDAELVTGRFTFNECPGGILNFSYRKYKGDKLSSYSLKDGEIYKIPRGVASHLVKTGKYKVHEHATNEIGKSIYRVSSEKQRYNFESLEFFDESDLKSDLYTVERI
jgi:hypothetical protein